MQYSNIPTHNMNNFIFVGYIKGLEYLWILGDEFPFRTIDKYFLQHNHQEYNGHSKEHYELLACNMSKYASTDCNVISRIQNKFAKTVNEGKFLPKMVVIVPDDDIIRCVDVSKEVAPHVWMCVLSWLMKEMKCIVLTQKEFLPTKAKRNGQPHFIWLEAPLNTDFLNNEDRMVFNTALHQAGKLNEGVTILKLKQVWEPDSQNYFISASLRYTSAGIST